MKAGCIPLIAAVVAGTTGFSPLANCSPAELERAVTLLRETRTDRCQQSNLRARILVAHQSHDEKTVRDIYPQLETLNARLKPSQDQLKVLSESIRLNSEEQSAYETAQLENGSCD
jgi:gamma-glutamyl phosphate reductase